MFFSELLQQYGNDGDEIRAAIRAEGKSAIPKLVEGLKEPSLPVRMIALTLLAEFGDECAVDPLMECLHSVNASGPAPPCDWRERVALLVSPWLRETRVEIHETERLLLRRRIAHTLSCIGDGRAIEPLRSLVHDPDPQTRDYACRGLQRLEAESP